MSDKDLVEAAFREFERALPATLKGRVKAVWKGKKGEADHPPIKRKKNVDEWRIRIMPTGRPRRPRGFWNAKWCFYELAAGVCPAGAVSQFVMFGDNGECSHGAYNADVDRILKAAAVRIGANYVPIQPQDKGAKLRIEFVKPDAKKLASGLIAIISETIDKFESLN